MSQHDMVIANADGATVRADINAALQALASTSKGNSAPSTIYAGQHWIDGDTPSSTEWTESMYDGADSIPLGSWDTTANKFKLAAGAALFSSLDADFIADATLVTGDCADNVLIMDASDSNNTKRALLPAAVLDSQTFSSVATWTKDSIPSTVNNLLLRFSARPATDAVNIQFVARKSSGTDITSYGWGYNLTANDVVAGDNRNTQTTAFSVGGVENTSPQGIVWGEIEIYDIQSSDHKGGLYRFALLDSTSGECHMAVGSFKVNDTAALTGFKLSFSSGNIAAGRGNAQAF